MMSIDFKKFEHLMKEKDAADFDYSYIESVLSSYNIEFANEKKKIGQKCEIDVFGKMS